jgi:hypothetical protein
MIETPLASAIRGGDYHAVSQIIFLDNGRLWMALLREFQDGIFHEFHEGQSDLSWTTANAVQNVVSDLQRVLDSVRSEPRGSLPSAR